MSGDIFDRISRREAQQQAPPKTETIGGDIFDRVDGREAAKTGFGLDFKKPKEVVRRQIKALPKGQRKAAMRQWADTFVAKERKENAGPLQYANDVARNLARGTPVGSWLDEASAATASLFGTDYDEALAYQRATDRAIDKESTKIGSLPVIGDVTIGGAQKLAGGLASAPVTPVVNAFRGGASLLPRMGNAAATGSLWGGVYGGGLGEGAADRGGKAAIGTIAGGVISGAAVPVGNALAAAIPSGRAPSTLRGYHPAAVRKVQRAFNDDFETGTTFGRTHPADRRYSAEAGSLGREGMLADMGPNMQAQLGAVGNMPGAGKKAVHRALHDRASGSQERINTATDAALGPARNLVAVEEATTRAARDAARPLYEQFYQTPIQMTPRLAQLLQRADAAGAMNRVARLMQIEGIQPGSVANNGRMVDLVKRAVDDMASGAERAGERNLHRIYSDLSRAIRNEVDTALSPNDPTQSIWAQARRAAGDGMQFSEGLEQGQRAFSRNLTPDRMESELATMTPPQRTAFQEGARDQIRQAMGNASTQFGENASAKGRALLGSGNARRKLNMLAPGQDGRNLVRRLDAESRFAVTNQDVLRNSQTSNRQAAQKEFPAPVDGSVAANELGKKNLTGLSMEAGYRVLNKVLSGALNARRLEIARDAAEMLIAQGVPRDRIARALLTQAQRQGVAAARQRSMQAFAQWLMDGGRQQSISFATPE